MSLSRLYWCCWFCCCWSAKKFRIIFFTPKCQHIHGNVNVCPELKYFMLRYFILWIFFGIEVRVNRNPHKKRSTRLSFFSRKAINKNRGKWIMHPMLQYINETERAREKKRFTTSKYRQLTLLAFRLIVLSRGKLLKVQIFFRTKSIKKVKSKKYRSKICSRLIHLEINWLIETRHIYSALKAIIRCFHAST